MSRLRIGFLGTGWIGRHRMQAMIETGAIEVAAICDPSEECAAEATKLAPGARLVGSLDEMLATGVDGVAVATPSALHAEQAIRALDAGAAVFCQKPLGRTANEAAAVVEAARRADRLLAVDFSYRLTMGMQAIASLVRDGALGNIFAVDLTFHNAYGPDKPWFYDRAQSGGGCVIDLGVHLVDLAMWIMDFPEVRRVNAHLSAKGRPVDPRSSAVEDYATATIETETGATVRLACSWNLPAGQDAIIEARFYGTEGGAAMRNVDGSFYDFLAERYRGTVTEQICAPPDPWGARAAAAWASGLARSRAFDPAAEQLVDIARLIDRIYAADDGVDSRSGS